MTLPPTHSDEVATVSSIGWVGKLRLREEVDKEPCPRRHGQDELGFEPGLAEPSAHRRGVASSESRRAGGARASWSPGDWLALRGKPGPHWALQLVGAEKSEAATSSANELPH